MLFSCKIPVLMKNSQLLDIFFETKVQLLSLLSLAKCCFINAESSITICLKYVAKHSCWSTAGFIVLLPWKYGNDFLLQIKELIRGPVPSAEFLEQCCPWLLPALFMHDDNDELKWIAEVITGLFTE